MSFNYSIITGDLLGMVESHCTPPAPLSEKENSKVSTEQKPIATEESQRNLDKVDEQMVIELSNHLNGSLKTSGTMENSPANEEYSNKVESAIADTDEEEPHSLCRWPSKSGIFRKV